MRDLGGGFGADNAVDSCEGGGVEGQSLLANEVLLVAASNDAGGWLRDTGGWLQTTHNGAGGWLRRRGKLASDRG
jgi:hypothetical protein